MLVIDERKMPFRVNDEPMSARFSPKNYGPVDDLSAIRPAPSSDRKHLHGYQPVSYDETPEISTLRAAWLTGHSALAVAPPL